MGKDRKEQIGWKGEANFNIRKEIYRSPYSVLLSSHLNSNSIVDKMQVL